MMMINANNIILNNQQQEARTGVYIIKTILNEEDTKQNKTTRREGII